MGPDGLRASELVGIIVLTLVRMVISLLTVISEQWSYFQILDPLHPKPGLFVNKKLVYRAL